MALTQRSIGKSRHRMILLVLTAITLLSLATIGVALVVFLAVCPETKGLSLEAAALEAALCTRVMATGVERITLGLSAAQARARVRVRERVRVRVRVRD